MAVFLALEYALAGSCDGGAYVVRASTIQEVANAIIECAGLSDGNETPPGAYPEEWCEEFRDHFRWLALAAADCLWHNPKAELTLDLLWRSGWVVRAWRVPAREARRWEDAA
jgi:hypothetical protein